MIIILFSLMVLLLMLMNMMLISTYINEMAQSAKQDI